MSNRVPLDPDSSEPAEPSDPSRAVRSHGAPRRRTLLGIAAMLALAVWIGVGDRTATGRPDEPPAVPAPALPLSEVHVSGARRPERAASAAARRASRSLIGTADVPAGVAAALDTVGRSTSVAHALTRRPAPDAALGQELIREDFSAPVGRELYRDAFDGPRTAFPLVDYESALTELVGGEFHVRMRQPVVLNLAIRLPIEDAAVQVAARAADGRIFGDYGVSLGSPDGRSFWFLDVFPARGTYALAQGVVGDVPRTLVAEAAHAAIRTGTGVNVLRLERRGDELRAYANGELLSTVSVPDLPATLYPGIVASSTARTDIDLYFDDFLVETVAGYDTEPATATPTRGTPTPFVTATPLPGGTVLLCDDFSRPSTRWPTPRTPEYEAEYVEDRYRIIVHKERLLVVMTMPVEVDDDYAVQAVVESNEREGLVGLVFGQNAQGDSGFRFVIAPHEGAYFLLNRQPGGTRYTISPTRSDAIRRDGPNVLRAERRGDELRLYVNGALIRTVVADVVSSGGFGVSAVNEAPEAGMPPFVAFFDDFCVTVVDRYEDASPTPPSPATPTPPGWRTATPAPSPTYGPWTLFRDSFEDPTSGWTRSRLSNEIHDYEDGEYRIAVSALRRIQRERNGPMLADVTAEVAMRAIGMDGSLYYGFGIGGLEFLASPWTGDLYLGTSQTTYVPWTNSNAVRAGERVNVLRLERRAHEVRLFINGYHQTTVEIDGLSQGQLELLAFNNGDPEGIDVRFDDVLVEAVDPASIPTPRPTATAPPRPLWREVLRETFERGDKWPEERGAGQPGVASGVWGGAYHALVAPPARHYAVVVDLDTPRAAVDVAVDAHQAETSRDGAYGLMFDAIDGSTYRLFLVRARDGHYALVDSDGVDGWRWIRDWTDAPAIHAGAYVNRLRVERWGGELALYANGELIEQRAGLPAQPGGVGLLAYNSGRTGGVHVDFDEFTIALPSDDVGGPTPVPIPATPSTTRRVWLPSLVSGAAVPTPQDPTSVPGRVAVRFGLALGPDGELLAPGDAFEHGTASLAAHVVYADLSPGRRIRWSWRLDGRALEGEGLSDAVVVDDAAGRVGLLIGSADGRALPAGRYELLAWLDDGAEPVTRAAATIQRAVPPGATARPSASPMAVAPSPTRRPPATPTVAPTAPLPAGCHELFANGGFEEGPTAWKYASWRTDGRADDPSAVIRRASDLVPARTAHEGDWLLAIEHGVSIQHWLAQVVPPWGLFEPDQLASATLQYYGAVDSEAIPDGADDHQLFPVIASVERLNLYGGYGSAMLSEEVDDPRAWRRFGPVDVSAALIRRPGWPAAFVGLAAAPSADDSPTTFYVDDVSLRVCMVQPFGIAGHLSPWLAARPNPAVRFAAPAPASAPSASTAGVRMLRVVR